jgi:hypothetical protein
VNEIKSMMMSKDFILSPKMKNPSMAKIKGYVLIMRAISTNGRYPTAKATIEKEKEMTEALIIKYLKSFPGIEAHAIFAMFLFTTTDITKR